MVQFKIYNKDVFKALKQLPDESVDCVITSPPYWGLRDYGVEGQIGLEKHPLEFIKKIADVFDEVKRVLKPTGTVWLNLGDSYYTKSGSGQGSNYFEVHKKLDGGRGKLTEMHTKIRGSINDGKWLQPKQRMLMPHRIAIEMQSRGWVLRNDLVWHKLNHMPSSVQDRLSNSFEFIFLFVKNRKYYFDLAAIRIPSKTGNGVSQGLNKGKRFNKEASGFGSRELFNNPKGKNPGDVFETTLEPFPEAHFACFPSALPEFCLKAGCPKKGTVLDPFVGSGTTLMVAQKIGLKGIGIELNSDYVKLIKKRLFGNENQTSLNPNKLEVIK